MKINPKVETITDELIDILKVPFFIAGGSLVKFTKDSDVDVFFYSQEDYYTAVSNSPVNYRVVKAGDSDLLSPLAIYNNMVQLIGFNVGTMQEVINTFDLNKSKVAYDPYTKEFLVDPSVKQPLHIVEGNIRKSTPSRFIKYYDSKTPTEERKHIDIPAQITKILNAGDVIDYYTQELAEDLPKEVLLLHFLNSEHTVKELVDVVDPELLYRMCKLVYYPTYMDYLYSLIDTPKDEYEGKEQKLYAIIKAFTEDELATIVNAYLTPNRNNFKDPYSRIPLFKQEHPEIFI